MKFALRLARDMGLTLRELASRMSSREFSLHMALAAADQAELGLPPVDGPEELIWMG